MAGREAAKFAGTVLDKGDGLFTLRFDAPLVFSRGETVVRLAGIDFQPLPNNHLCDSFLIEGVPSIRFEKISAAREGKVVVSGGVAKIKTHPRPRKRAA